MGNRYFATAFVHNLAKVVSQGEFNMPRHHILWSSAHIKAILMKIIFNSEKSGPAKTGLVAMALAQVETLSLTKEVTKEGEPRAPPKCHLPSTVMEIQYNTIA